VLQKENAVVNTVNARFACRGSGVARFSGVGYSERRLHRVFMVFLTRSARSVTLSIMKAMTMYVKNQRINVAFEKPLFKTITQFASKECVSKSLKACGLVKEAFEIQEVKG